MPASPTEPLRDRVRRLRDNVVGENWFPHVPLAALLAMGGVWLLLADLGGRWQQILDELASGSVSLYPTLLPAVLIGFGMLIMAAGLLLRSRLAWLMALLLATGAAGSMYFRDEGHPHLLFGYFLLMLALLAFAWRQFDRTSLAASTLFAIASIVMLMVYATFGAFYLGAGFRPPITNIVTALYYAMVTMSTVGYGDITPETPEARLFAISLIVLGLTAFVTSLTAVVGPLVSRSLQRIVNQGNRRMRRENHFVVVGNTPLAINTWRELARRGLPVTRLLTREPDTPLTADVDREIGEPSDGDVLRKTGAARARAVLAMLDDDSENAFVVLAVRELGGSAQTVAAVNEPRHLGRVQLAQPDVVIAPQILGGELAAMLVTGEPVTPEFIMQRVVHETGAFAAAPPRTHS